MKQSFWFILTLTTFFILIYSSCKKPITPSASFDLSSTSIYTRCPIVFTNMSSDAESYLWNFGDGNTSIEESPEHTYMNAGDFTVTLEAINNDESEERTQAIHVKQLPLFQGTFVSSFTNSSDGQRIVGLSIANDGNIVFGGRLYLDGLGFRTYISKRSPKGQLLWERTHHSSVEEWVNNMIATDDGGYMMGFSYKNNGTNWNFAAKKLSSNGDLIWSKDYPLSLEDGVRSIVASSDGGFLLTGYTYSVGAGAADGYVIKINANGNQEWAKSFGGTQDDIFNNAITTPDGGYLLYGWTGSIGAGSADLWVVKINSTGILQWEKAFGFDGWDSGSAIALAPDGGFIISGNSWTNGGSYASMLTYRLDSNGNTLWQKKYGTDQSNDGVHQIFSTSDGGYVILGDTENGASGETDAYVIKIDDEGNILWDKKYGGSNKDGFDAFAETSNCSYVFGGFWDDPVRSYFIAKTDIEGNQF